MMDMFADELIKRCINRVIENKDTISDDYAIWYTQTKGMVRRYGVTKIINQILQIVEELSDEDWFEKKYPKEIFQDLGEKRMIKKTNSAVRDLINTKIKISEVARDTYHLDVKKGKCTCPFHNDSAPSLSFDDKRNIFNCFGCSAKGSLVTFIRMMEETPYGIKNKRS